MTDETRSRKIRVLLVDDHGVVIDAGCAAISSCSTTSRSSARPRTVSRGSRHRPSCRTQAALYAVERKLVHD